MGSFVGGGANGGVGSTSHSVTWPTTADGDFAILVAAHNSVRSFTNPTGFGTPVDVTVDGSCEETLWTRVCDGSESGSLTLTDDGTGAFSLTLFVVRGYSGIDVRASTARPTNSATMDCPSVTPTVADAAVIVTCAARITNEVTTATAPTSFNSNKQEFGTGGTGAVYVGIAWDGGAVSRSADVAVDPGNWSGLLSSGDDGTARTIALIPEVTSSEVTNTIATSWAVRSSISNTLAASWAVRAEITRSLATSYAVRASLSQTVASSWAVRASVSVSATTSWAVRASVTRSLATSYAVRQALSATNSSSWAVRAALSRTVAASWAVRQTVSANYATSWNVGATGEVTTSYASSWAVRASVSRTLATSYAVRGAVSVSSAVSWAVRESLTSTTATSWAVRASVSSSNVSSWAVRTSITRTASVSWAVRAQVMRTLSTSWDVESEAPLAGIVRATLAPRSNGASLRPRAVSASLLGGVVTATLSE